MRVLVTGSSTGLGLNAARQLVAEGHEVVVHVRDRSRRPAGTWSGVVVGDLADLGQTRDVAEQAEGLSPYDAVIHNAGVIEQPLCFAVNVVAPYVLTTLIAKPKRLVYLSSGMHQGGSTDLGRADRGQVTYSDSKLWVTTLSAALSERWPGTTTHAVDPGWVPTRMGGSGAPDDLTKGHETQVWLATTAEVSPRTGGYWHHRRAQRPHPSAIDPTFQSSLLALLADRTGIVLT